MVKNNFLPEISGALSLADGDFWVGVKYNLITAPLSAALNNKRKFNVHSHKSLDPDCKN